MMIPTLLASQSTHRETVFIHTFYRLMLFLLCVLYSTRATRSWLVQLQWFDHHFSLLKVYFSISFFHRHVLFRGASQHSVSQQPSRITAQIISSTLAVGNNSVCQSVGESLLSANRSSGQDQIEGSGQTDEMRKAHGAPIDQRNS